MPEGPWLDARRSCYASIAFWTRCSPGARSFLIGGPGIGKTTLLVTAADSARDRSIRVLAARPSSSAAQRPFGGLMDLCDGLGEAEFAPLPAPRRRGLEAALMRAEPATEPGPTSAVALGLMGVVRGLAAGGPVVIAVDDLQWLDRSSAEAVAFVAGRLAGARVGFLLALRRVPRGFLRRRSQGAGWSASRSDRCRLARCGGCCSSTSAFRPAPGSCLRHPALPRPHGHQSRPLPGEDPGRQHARAGELHADGYCDRADGRDFGSTLSQLTIVNG